MKRLYEVNGVMAKGNILSLAEFRPFIDMDEINEDTVFLDSLVSLAEEMLDEEVPMLTLSLYRSFFKTGDRMTFDKPYLRRRFMLAVLTYAEYREGKGRFTEKLCDLVFAILEESTWVIHAHSKHFAQRPGTEVADAYLPEHLHGIDLRAAMTGGLLALTYHLCKDALDSVSDVIAKRLKYTVRERIVRPFIEHDFTWPINNWCTYIVSGVLFATAFLEDMTERREAVAEKSMRILDNYIATYPEDGGCDEGAGYWSGASGAYFDCAEMLFDMSRGRIDIFSYPELRAIGEFEPRMYIKGKRFINFADCHALISCDGKLLRRFGIRVGSEEMRSFGEMLAKEYPIRAESAFTFAHVYRSLKNMRTPLALGEVKTVLFRRVWFPNLKIAVFRESSDAVGTLLAIKGGDNAESHNHNDVGSFMVYADGEPVIIDAGSGVYTKKTFSSERYTIWNMMSEYHNLPVFGGIGERNGKSFASRDEEFDENVGAVAMELSGAYPEEAGLVSFKRSASLDGSDVHIVDSFELVREMPVEFRFLTAAEPKLIEVGRIELACGRELIFDKALDPELVSVETESYNPKSAFGVDLLWQIRLKTDARCGRYEFDIIKTK